MKTQLIKLQGKFILVSDEEITDVRPYKGKWHIEKGSIMNQFPNYLTDLSECKLIIAGIPELPSVDFSDLKEEDCKRIGLSTIDLTKLCYYDQRNPNFQIKEEFGYDKEEVDVTGNFSKKDCACDNCFYGRAKLTEQLITAQSLNDKMFSLDDMRKAFESGTEFEKSSNKNAYNDYDYNKDIMFNEIIQSLQQTVWDVEVEMDCVYQGKCVKERCLTHLCDEKQPKITNGSIKITKIL